VRITKSTSVDRGHDEVSGLAPKNVKKKKRERREGKQNKLNDRLVILPILYLYYKMCEIIKIKLLN
jgi:hypothetical protein